MRSHPHHQQSGWQRLVSSLIAEGSSKYMTSICHNVGIGIAILAAALITSAPPRAEESLSLKNALEAARWIRSSAIQTETGVVWPADSRDRNTVSTDLYNGIGTWLLHLDAFEKGKKESIVLPDSPF